MRGSSSAAGAEPAAVPGKRERLVAAGCDLVYRQGVQHTTLADIAEAAGVPLGNVYYYFKTKDDLVAAVVDTHVEHIDSGLRLLERRHRSPKARLKALVGSVAEQRDAIARYGCPYGTLAAELAKRGDQTGDVLAARLMRALLGWAEQQFRAMGRRDAGNLAVEFVIAYQGSAVVSNALGVPDVMAGHARRVQKWLDALQP